MSPAALPALSLVQSSFQPSPRGGSREGLVVERLGGRLEGVTIRVSLFEVPVASRQSRVSIQR